MLVAAGIVAASMLVGGEAGDYSQKVNQNIVKLDAVEAAMKSFMTKNGRRPCPADGQYDINTSYYGIEAATPGTCTGSTPAASMGPDSATGNVVSGTIPTKTLNLPDEYGIDAWGRRFTYVIDKRATSVSTCYAMQNSGTNGGVQIKTGGSGSILDNTVYAFLSHGPDGYGAWPAQGSSVAGRVNTGSTDIDTQINAGVDATGASSTFTYNTTNFTNVRIKKDPTKTFDDLVYYHKDTKNTCCISGSCFGAISGKGSGSGTNYTSASPASQGFIYQGTGTQYAGRSLAIGDVNGDGIDDLIIGAPRTNSLAGAVYVVFGNKNTLLSGSNLLSGVASPGGFVINGATAGDQLGWTVAVGDINGDGIKDIIIAASNANSSKGAVYVIFGKTSAWSTPVTVSTYADGTNGFMISPDTSDGLTTVASGDINGDGYDDVIIGSWTGFVGAYVVFGKSTGWSATFSLPPASSATGLKLDAAPSTAGTSVASGDVNGDGISDLIIGISGATVGGNTNAGKTYVVFGKTSGWTTPITLTSSADGTAGFVANGVAASDFSGSIVSAGDLNGDGISDVIISAASASPGGRTNAGSVYVVYGKNPWSGAASVDLSALSASSTGFRVDGGWASDYAGYSNAGSCDVNGDGIADLLIGAYNATTTYSRAGRVYIVFGKSTGWTDTYNLSNLNGANGVIINGIAVTARMGTSVVGGDITGSGKCIMLTGGYSAGSNAGYVYAVRGRSSWTASFDLNTLTR